MEVLSEAPESVCIERDSEAGPDKASANAGRRARAPGGCGDVERDPRAIHAGGSATHIERALVALQMGARSNRSIRRYGRAASTHTYTTAT